MCLDHGIERKRRSRFALAPSAMAAVNEQRRVHHAIAKRSTRASTVE
jgi:hypothetical protein